MTVGDGNDGKNMRHFWIPAYAGRTVERAGMTVISYRHSRVSGNPDGTEKTSPLPPNRRRIPAYAGMTVRAVNTVLQIPKILSILSIHV